MTRDVREFVMSRPLFVTVLFTAGAVCCALLLLTSATATASEPVLASAESEAEAEERVRESAAPHRPSTLLRRTVYDAGRWSVGVDGIFSMTSSRVELLDEEQREVTDSTRFLRIDPWVTVAVIDRVEVGLITGLVSRRLSQENADSSTDTALAFQPVGRYNLPVSHRIAIYGQLAPGFYLGRSQRTVPAQEEGDEPIENERTNTRGFVYSMGAGVNYRLTEGVQLRFGLAFNGLWGRESFSDDSLDLADESLSTSTTNFGTSAGIRYTF